MSSSPRTTLKADGDDPRDRARRPSGDVVDGTADASPQTSFPCALWLALGGLRLTIPKGNCLSETLLAFDPRGTLVAQNPAPLCEGWDGSGTSWAINPANSPVENEMTTQEAESAVLSITRRCSRVIAVSVAALTVAALTVAATPAQATSVHRLTSAQLLHLSQTLRFAPAGFVTWAAAVQTYGSHVDHCNGLPNSIDAAVGASREDRLVGVEFIQLKSPAAAAAVATDPAKALCGTPVRRVKVSGLAKGAVELVVAHDTGDGLAIVQAVGPTVLIAYIEPRTAFGAKAQSVLQHASSAASTAYRRAAD